MSSDVLALLRAAPLRLIALADGVPLERLHAAPEEGAWSARDVLAHLRACAEVWGGCIARLLAEARPTIRAVNPRTWAEQTDYLTQPFPASLQSFSRQRADLLGVLDGLDEDQWARAGTVTGAGRPLERTVLSYAEWLATHERSHLRQVERLLR